MSNTPSTASANRFRFRAWHKDKEKMLTVEMINFVEDGGWVVFKEDIARITPIEAMEPNEPCFVCSLAEVVLIQSTGLPDKNGVELFGGDILQGGDDLSNFVIVWYEDRWQGDGPGGSFDLFELLLNGYERIGNIYENPELLPTPKP